MANATAQGNKYTYDGIENATRQQLIVTKTGTWLAPWDASITRQCVVTIVGGGGAGGCGGVGGIGYACPGFGGGEGSKTVFGDYSVDGGGGGAGGANGSAGAGGGAGMVRRFRVAIQGGTSHAVTIGAGGEPGNTAHATTYTQQKGGGVLGGRPMGSVNVYDSTALGSADGGDGGDAGRDSYPNYSSWSQGSRGGRNGTGFGGGGGGGAYGYGNWGTDKGGLGYDGGLNGRATIENPTSVHDAGGKGGNGAVIIEWDQ